MIWKTTYSSTFILTQKKSCLMIQWQIQFSWNQRKLHQSDILMSKFGEIGERFLFSGTGSAGCVMSKDHVSTPSHIFGIFQILICQCCEVWTHFKWQKEFYLIMPRLCLMFHLRLHKFCKKRNFWHFYPWFCVPTQRQEATVMIYSTLGEFAREWHQKDAKHSYMLLRPQQLLGWPLWK